MLCLGRQSAGYGVTNMSTQNWLNPNLVRLQKAVLCANCEVISEGLNDHCACCGSQSLLSLNTVLGGEIEPEMSFDPVKMQRRYSAGYIGAQRSLRAVRS